MAKSDLSLNIGSKFNGEGFKKLDSSLKDASKQAKNATDTISKISGAISSIDGEVGKVAGKLTSVLGSFAQGGIIGLAIAGVTALVGTCVSKFNELRERAKLVGDTIKENMVKGMQTVLDKTTQALTAFDKLKAREKQQGKVRDNAQNVNDTIAANQIKQQHIQNRVAVANDEFAFERDAAKERLELAKLEAEQKKQAAQARLDAAQKELQDEQARLKLIEQEQSEIQKKHEEVYQMESDYLEKLQNLSYAKQGFEHSGNKERAAEMDLKIAELKKEFENSVKNIKSADDAVGTVLKQWQAQTEKVVAAQVNLEMETKNMEGAESTYQTTLMSAEEAYQSQIKGVEKREQAERERAKKEQEAAEAKIKKEEEAIAKEQRKIELAEERAKLEEERNKKIEESKEREEELDKQIKELTEAIKKKEQEIADFKLQDMNDGIRKLGDIRKQRRKAEIQNEKKEDQQARVKKQAEGAVMQKVKQIADKDGNMRKANEANIPWLERTVQEAIAAGVSNEELSKILGSNFRASLGKQKQALVDRQSSGKNLSKAEQDKLSQIDNILNMTEDKESNINVLKQELQHAQEDKDDLQRDMRDSLKDIKNKMDNLGL